MGEKLNERGKINKGPRIALPSGKAPYRARYALCIPLVLVFFLETVASPAVGPPAASSLEMDLFGSASASDSIYSLDMTPLPTTTNGTGVDLPTNSDLGADFMVMSSGAMSQHGENPFGDLPFIAIHENSSNQLENFAPVTSFNSSISTGGAEIFPPEAPTIQTAMDFDFDAAFGVTYDPTLSGQQSSYEGIAIMIQEAPLTQASNDISAKINPHADIGIDFDSMNRKEKRREDKKVSTAPVSITNMGKAMGSGSGIGRAGASALAVPSNPMMGNGMGMGMGGMGMMGGAGMGMGMMGGSGMGMGMGMMGGAGMGMGMSGYGGSMNQPMGMGMNMGMNQGMMPQRPQMGGPPGGNGMPGAGYNPMMGMGNYGSQQPYGGGGGGGGAYSR
ncbi:hypothetical protein GW17_00027432 [Ensete ventricosum]|nr:hypothetical protein GW17_00027432 [Ensete ventricosum]